MYTRICEPQLIINVSVLSYLRDKRRKGPNASKTSEGYLLINACTGHVYSAGDPHCPLKEICCLATPYNIWANIQVHAQPCEMSYDILNVDQWRPFFGKRLPPPSGGLHTCQVEFYHRT